MVPCNCMEGTDESDPASSGGVTSKPMDPLTGIFIDPVLWLRDKGVIGLIPSSSKLPTFLVASNPNRKEFDLLIKISSTRKELERPLA